MTPALERLMTIEGIDGAGKSTQVSSVVAALRAVDVDAVATVVRAHAARTVNVLAERLTGDPTAYHPLVPPELREWVFACDIARFGETEIRPLHDAGRTIIQDRGPLSYRKSAELYGGYSAWVDQVHALFYRPRHTYILDLPVDVALTRLRRRSSKRADESHTVLGAMRDALLTEAARSEHVTVLDATRAAGELTTQIVHDWSERTSFPIKIEKEKIN